MTAANFIVTISILMVSAFSFATSSASTDRSSNPQDSTLAPEPANTEIIKKLSSLCHGEVSTFELRIALLRQMPPTTAGQNLHTSGLEVAKAILKEKTSMAKLDRNALNPEARKLLDQKLRALRVLPKFLASASIISTGFANSDRFAAAFFKELTEVPNLLTKMPLRELRDHLDLIEKDVQIAQANRELSGDEAFAKAIKETYGP